MPLVRCPAGSLAEDSLDAEEATLKRAVALHGEGRLAQAAALYAQLIAVRPAHPDALHLLGVSETQLGRPRIGLDWIAKSLALNPHQPVALANQGNAWLALNDPGSALSCYEQSLHLWPDYGLAVFGRGNAQVALGRLDEALASFDRTLTLAPRFVPALLGRAGVLLKLKRHGEAAAGYDRAIALAPQPRAYLGRAAAHLGLRLHDEAALDIDRALELAPDLADAHADRGHLLSQSGDAAAAVDAYDRALMLNPSLAGAWVSRGIALSLLARYADAADSLSRALDIDPDHPYALGARLHAQLQLCDWRDHAAGVADIAAALANDRPADFPFSFLAVCDSPALQLRCAALFTTVVAGAPAPLWPGRPALHDRIRIAYVSADFLEHPTAYLMAGVFEKHDRQRFEVIGVSLRTDRSAMAQRVCAAFDRSIDAANLTDREVAQSLRDLGVDVAVDLMGYTGEHRSGIFAQRAAPTQVHYLGFPATMGARHIDYLIADEFLIPEAARAHYSEHIAYLPDSFQANDDRRPIAAERPTRRECGLPDAAVVFCSFHGRYKINPPVFDVWARLLSTVPGSVLWLVGGTPPAEENLRREAERRGVAGSRLVFAPPLPYARHLARLTLADLCLDTVPFNGGATTSDALWAGVPVVTCCGSSFAARMSGSLLSALGMADLIRHSLPDYEALALALAQNPAALAGQRARLAQRRNDGALFDTQRFCRHLESAFSVMVTRQRTGVAPATFHVRRLEAAS